MQTTFVITTIADGFYIFLATEHNWLSAASNCITFSSYILQYAFSVSSRNERNKKVQTLDVTHKYTLPVGFSVFTQSWSQKLFPPSFMWNHFLNVLLKIKIQKTKKK